MAITDKSIETESRLWLPGAEWGVEEDWEITANGYGFFFQGVEKWWWHDSTTPVNTKKKNKNAAL